MADLIDRQRLLDALHDRLCHPKTPKQSPGIAAAEKLVKKQPAIQPKRGEWLDVDLSGYSDHNDIHCGLCFRPAAGKTNYCPHCGANMGADMRGEEDD